MIGKKLITASRYSWLLANGPIPSGVGVLHSCDNTICVNPAHLFIGDQHINMRDMAIKGRGRWQRISNDDVAKIRASKERNVDIAKRYGVTGSMIGQIKRGVARVHV